MTKTLSLLAALVLGSTLISETASAAVQTNSSSVQVAQSSLSNFNIQKFDSNLGTLTGVTVTVDFATLQGAFTVQNNDATAVTVSSYTSTFSIRGSTNALGYTPQSVSFDGFSNPSPTTSPDWSSTSIASGATQEFTLGAGQDFTTLLPRPSAIISASFISAYESAGGSGVVTFQALNNQSISTTGSSYSVNSETAGANTQISVIYTYTAVPEPSTYALMGLGALALVVVYRRRTA